MIITESENIFNSVIGKTTAKTNTCYSYAKAATDIMAKAQSRGLIVCRTLRKRGHMSDDYNRAEMAARKSRTVETSFQCLATGENGNLMLPEDFASVRISQAQFAETFQIANR